MANFEDNLTNDGKILYLGLVKELGLNGDAFEINSSANHSGLMVILDQPINTADSLIQLRDNAVKELYKVVAREAAAGKPICELDDEYWALALLSTERCARGEFNSVYINTVQATVNYILAVHIMAFDFNEKNKSEFLAAAKADLIFRSTAELGITQQELLQRLKYLLIKNSKETEVATSLATAPVPS